MTAPSELTIVPPGSNAAPCDAGRQFFERRPVGQRSLTPTLAFCHRLTFHCVVRPTLHSHASALTAFVSFIIAALALTPRCPAFSLGLDGWASLEIVLATDSSVVCLTEQSQPQLTGSLFALDARTGALRWRTACRPGRSEGTLVGPGADTFCLVTGDFLERRSLATGKLLWSTRLDAIPHQKVKPPRSVREIAEETVQNGLEKLGLRAPVITVPSMFGTPNHYIYSKPLETGARIFIHREAMEHHGGCTSMHCFSDWLLFDLATGRFISGDDGNLLGTAAGCPLVGSEQRMQCIAGGTAQEVDTSALLNSRYRSAWFRESADARLSLGDSCLLPLADGAFDGAAIYRRRENKLTPLPPPTHRTNEQSSWVLLERYLLRYAQCPRSSTDPKGSLSSPWFELYDLHGQLVHSGEIARSTDDRHWWVSFESRQTNAVEFKVNNRLVRVEIPSLKMVAQPAPVPGAAPSSSSSLVRHGNVAYEARGQIHIQKMKSAAETRELSVTARDTLSGRQKWRHLESVRIERRQPPSSASGPKR